VANTIPAARRIRVWDLPTRLAHWSIVILFGVCWWTAKSDHMQWHLVAGYGMLAAVWFRLAWGFWGGETARFGHFVRGPGATLRYVRKLFARGEDGGPAPIGHNPLGALSILAMIGLLLTQTTFGLLAVNIDGFASGPLARWVSFSAGRRFAHWHAANFNLLIAVVVIHLAAITFYRWVRKERLIPAMIHGHKTVSASIQTPYFVSWWRAIALATGIVICVALIANIRSFS
jgi:cytochrome b